MFENVEEFFQEAGSSLRVDRSGNPTDHDIHIATVVLMVEMAGKDSTMAPAEAQEICRLLGQEFRIPESEIPELVTVAVEARRNSKKIDQFIEVINESFSDEQKVLILAAVWRVVKADGKIDQFESMFADELRERFGLSPEQGNEARRIAAREFEHL